MRRDVVILGALFASVWLAACAMPPTPTTPIPPTATVPQLTETPSPTPSPEPPPTETPIPETPTPEPTPTAAEEAAPDWAVQMAAEVGLDPEAENAVWNEEWQGYVKKDAEGNITEYFGFERERWARVTDFIDEDGIKILIVTDLTQEEIAEWKQYENLYGTPNVETIVKPKYKDDVAKFYRESKESAKVGERENVVWQSKDGQEITSKAETSHIVVNLTFGPPGFKHRDVYGSLVRLESLGWIIGVRYVSEEYISNTLATQPTVQGNVLVMNYFSFSGDEELPSPIQMSRHEQSFMRTLYEAVYAFKEGREGRRLTEMPVTEMWAIANADFLLQEYSILEASK